MSDAATTQARQGPTFAALTRTIRDAGLLERRRDAYVALIAINGMLLAGVVTALVLGGPWLSHEEHEHTWRTSRAHPEPVPAR